MRFDQRMMNYWITTILITNMHKSLSSMPQESSLFTRHFDSSTTWRTMYSFQGNSSASLTQLRMEHEIIAWLSPSQWDFLLGVGSSPTVLSWLFCMECHSFIFTCGAWLEVVFEFEWEQPILLHWGQPYFNTSWHAPKWVKWWPSTN